MKETWRYLNHILAAGAALVMFSLPLQASGARLDTMLSELATAEPREARRIAAEIELEWSKSGSPAMDVLLRRGKGALEAGDPSQAIAHLTAATDHAPDFAEAYFLRSVAYARQERFGLAMRDIATVLTLEPRHYNALFGLGVILDQTGAPALARDALIRAHSIHPHHEELGKALERVSRKIGGTDL